MSDVLPFALAAALTPTGCLAGLLLLLSPRPTHNGGAFLTGWMLGIFISAIVMLRLGAEPSVVTAVEREPLLRPAIVLLAGLAMIVGGILGLRSQRKEAKEPRWLRTVDSFSPATSFGLGFVLGGLSPKLLFLTAAATMSLLLSGASRLLEFLGLVGYILVASLPILIPVLFVLHQRDRAFPRLAAWKAWLIFNQSRLLGAGSILMGLLLVAYAAGSVTQTS
jgi:hypothetical protein